MRSKNILDYFPSGYKPSDIQARVLTELQYRWNSADVFILNLQVASGKSWLAHTIASWAGGGRICTPTTVLVDQYAKDFPDTAVIKAPGHYVCETRKSKCGAFASKARCRGCVYNKSMSAAKIADVSISTYHMNLTLPNNKKLKIFDEAHNLSRSIRDMYSKSITPHRIGMPLDCVGDFDAVKDWLNSMEKEDFERLSGSNQALLKGFKHDLNEGTGRALNFYTWGTGWWSGGGEMWGEKLERGEPVEVPKINIIPIDVFDKPSLFWEPNQKLVLMSATIGRPDLYELGLDKKRPVFIEGDSPIPLEHQPIFKDYVGSINHTNEDLLLDGLAAKIKHYLDTKEGSGVIHITYRLANKLKRKLSHERLLTHDASNMREQLGVYLASENKVFLVSGMYEGVSLDYDKARWQAIAKVSWPSLVDPLQRHRAKDEPDYYLWSTIKNVIQTAGRVCRRPDDYGETYILDESFERLLSQGKHLLPRSFKERIMETSA